MTTITTMAASGDDALVAPRRTDFAEQAVAGFPLVAKVLQYLDGGAVQCDRIGKQVLQPFPHDLFLRSRPIASIEQVLEAHHAHVVERIDYLDALAPLGDRRANLVVGPPDADGDQQHGAEHQAGRERGFAADLHRTTVTRSGLSASKESSARCETKLGMGWLGA
jgi:hypothetical protein